ncbi:MAG: 2-oxoacid:acceptor oxidoreductase family protein [Actinobacteria bacterium]|nr:2-oxoacid:acceptor oxidoreductase family protein [Actinomycetota bacterium]
MVEVIWHARAGQGAVTASKYLAESAMDEGFYIQAFPEYGAERRGAPVKSFTRISDKPVRVHSQIYNPNVVLILDPSLVGMSKITDGLQKGGKIIVNTTKSPKEIANKLGISDEFEVHTLDATGIANETIGRPLPNMPMLAAFIKVTGLLNMEKVMERTKKELSKRFNEKVVNGNLEAIRRGYEEVN